MQKPETYFLQFSECLAKIDREIPPEKIGFFYRFIDSFYDNAWTKALLRFERAVLKIQEGGMSQQDFNNEKSIYFETMMSYVQEFRKNNSIDERTQFLKSLRE